MQKLDELLTVLDQRERESALLKYAGSLGIDTISAKSRNGRFNEEKLVLLIHDCQLNQRATQKKNAVFLSASVILAIAISALFFSLPKLMDAIYEDNFGTVTPSANVMRAYDTKGAPITENNQPVLFEPMQGLYTEYNDKGKPVIQNFYSNGQLLWTKKLGANGSVTSTQNYPAK